MTTVGIIQPNFIPWRGYFDFINDVDIFVILDDVQYTKQDWRNRNRIRTQSGKSDWLTVPINSVSLKQLIRDVQLNDRTNWRESHLSKLRQTYGKTPYFSEIFPLIEAEYGKDTNSLLDLDIDLIKTIMAFLGITTKLCRASDIPSSGVRDEKLIDIVSHLGGTRYLSGPAAKSYIQPSMWQDNGIELAFKTYPDYPAYEQITEPYDPFVSIIDLMFMKGPDSAGLIWNVV